jgi:hypothetical protein
VEQTRVKAKMRVRTYTSYVVTADGFAVGVVLAAAACGRAWRGRVGKVSI